MTNLVETATYDAGVYQIETTDLVKGGATGVTNTPLRNLANRTAYLKQKVDALAGHSLENYVSNAMAYGPISIDLSVATVFYLTLVSNATILFVNPPALLVTATAGQLSFFSVIIKCSTNFASSVTWPTVEWVTTGGVPPDAPLPGHISEYIFNALPNNNYVGRRGAAT